MRTQEQTTAFIDEHRDFLGTVAGDLVPYLSFELARRYLTDEAVQAYEDGAKAWPTKTFDREAVIAEMREYMPFALGKCIDNRGLSMAQGEPCTPGCGGCAR